MNNHNEQYNQFTEEQRYQLQYQDALEANRVFHSMNETNARINMELQARDTNRILDVEADEKRQKKRADVASMREMQKRKLLIDYNTGDIFIYRDLFNGVKKDLAPFRYQKHTLLRCSEMQETILWVMFSKGAKKSVEIFLKTNELDERIVNKKFNAAGIHLGYSHRIETQMRVLLITQLLEIGEEKYLPPHHGWYKKADGSYDFCFPDKRSWEEVKRRV